ncbi:MAG: DUF2124 family protein [Methanotrichaceae archaeon]
MEKIQDIKGLGGLLNGFRDLVKEDESVTFIGTPGFCMPFALFQGFPIRNKKLAFIPNLDADKTRELVNTEYGMELGKPTSPDADVIAILGGLAMPKIGVDVEDMKKLLEKVHHKKLIGICFMGILQQAGWYDALDFDCVMNTTLIGDISKK